jgi:single-strand DNA-binding protein
MASLNKVLLIGNLGADPELSYTPGGTAKATMRLATHEVWTDNDGEKNERTTWHRVIAWGRLAEICGEYLTKGRQIFIEGRLQTRSWGPEGERKYITEVIAVSMQMLGSPKDIPAKASADGAPEAPAHTADEEDIFPDA